MATYTMQLRDVKPALAAGGVSFDALDNYPLFDATYRAVLNQKILDEYWTQEINFETPMLFNIRLRTRMNKIMPLYNQMYESEKLKFDPLNWYSDKEEYSRQGQTDTNSKRDINQTEQHTDNATGKVTGTTSGKSDATTKSNVKDAITSSGTTSNNSTKVHSELPQNQLEIGSIRNAIYANDGEWTAEDGTYSNKQDGTSDTTGETHGTTSGTSGTDTTSNATRDDTITTGDNMVLGIKNLDDWVKTKTGMMQNPSEALNAFRSTFLNIDAMIVDELKDLFMGLW